MRVEGWVYVDGCVRVWWRREGGELAHAGASVYVNMYMHAGFARSRAHAHIQSTSSLPNGDLHTAHEVQGPQKRNVADISVVQVCVCVCVHK